MCKPWRKVGVSRRTLAPAVSIRSERKLVVSYRLSLTVLLVVAMCAMASASAHADDVSFSREVLPVLSDRCFHCHGPDETHREADLRLDLELEAKQDRGGYAAVSPNSLEESELWRRIISNDEAELMPPPDSHRKPLSEKEREAIRRWILNGAKWGKHWSFEKLQRPEVPKQDTHPIDAFVLQRLQEEGLEFSPPAEAQTLLRRLSFDLTGLAPTPEQLASLNSYPNGEVNWSSVTENMLASPHHAERMAMWWLDAARYSDSDGFQQDSDRQNWPWRDWVIQQFAQNRPYDEFTREQFAGDLLPDATDETRLATTFHRNHMSNGEGGRDPEESRIDYVIDRVNTTGTVWLGLTLGCVQCHSHKFDPITQHEYYSLFAFFDSIDETGGAGGKANPFVQYASPLVADRVTEQQAYSDRCEQQVREERKRADQRFNRWLEAFVAAPPSDYKVWYNPAPEVSSAEGTEFSIDADQIVQTIGPIPFQDDYRIVFRAPENMSRITGFKIEVFPHESHENGKYARNGNGEFTLTNVLAMGRAEGSPSERQIELSQAVASHNADAKRKSAWDAGRYDSIVKTLNDDARDGWTTEGIEAIEPRVGLFQLAEPWEAKPGDQFIIVLRHRSTHGNASIGRFRLSLTSELGQVVTQLDAASPIMELMESLAADPGKPIDGGLRKRLLDQYLLADDVYQKVRDRAAAAVDELNRLKNETKPRRVMVLAERDTPRNTYILERGVWDAKGEQVERGFISHIFEVPKPEEGKTLSRLDLADWILDKENPLTARVTVNHLWQLMFGQGLVRTPEDFGLQGELPTHPELLDWLAIELIESGWDLRHILRLIVTSKTYRQSSGVTKPLLEKDPENRLLARAPRFRLPAWMIRDNALHVSGLLNNAVGGPPAKPYQPEGVWAEITMGRFRYSPSVGPEQYRRTVYAFWRRTLAPTFLFDSAQRRLCEVGVRRTNTPMHALTLMNDTTMLEASRALADIAVERRSNKDSIEQTLNDLSMRVLSRKLNRTEQAALESVLVNAKQHYESHAQDAARFIDVGLRETAKQQDAVSTAAWMIVSSTLLNLDEAITRE
ncbi:PSD1 and planctomycete cytochrome C domain-containing protein [Blastopirellula sp. JC733]|nr:PSD1 and planctomycete cytochrome C domain-containing protein [Blastopirellula sediminis]